MTAGGADEAAGLRPLFEDGSLRPPAIAARYPLAGAPAAYQRVASGALGKVVLLP